MGSISNFVNSLPQSNKNILLNVFSYYDEDFKTNLDCRISYLKNEINNKFDKINAIQQEIEDFDEICSEIDQYMKYNKVSDGELILFREVLGKQIYKLKLKLVELKPNKELEEKADLADELRFVGVMKRVYSSCFGSKQDGA